ncbi:MAG TPA: TlpA disulfide reductase family protein [Saprospiraceae bacterium]|nr:TlpA disulfide reductase family protein [Saprospiraceae bacterium]HMQ85352.1 TlpA disulfide reductase family protein [Saprospiraceae bacterium]
MDFKNALLILALCLGANWGIAQNAIPDTEVKTLDGQTINIREFAENGKITVLSFWATWCSPCKKELDAIADLYPEWQETYDMELVAITIDTRRELGKVRPMVESKGWEYTILSDENQQLMNALNFQTVPQTFLLDRQGNIVYAHSGYVPGDEYELEAKMKAIDQAPAAEGDQH